MKKWFAVCCLFAGVGLLLSQTEIAGVWVGQGLKLILKSTPSNPPSGQIEIFGDVADGKAKRINSSGTVVDLEAAASSAFDPTEVDKIRLDEEFLSGSPATSGTIGSSGMGLPISCTGGGPTLQAGVWPNLGLMRIATGATGGNACAIGWTAVSTGFGALGNNTNKDWRFTWVGRLNTTSAVRFRLGFGTCNTTQPADMFGLRFDTSAGFADATNFQIFNRVSSGTESNASSGTAVDTNFHTVRIYADGATAAKVWIQIDGATPVTICAAGCTLTATPPTANLTWCSIIATDTTSSATFDVDKFAFYASGLGTTTARN